MVQARTKADWARLMASAVARRANKSSLTEMVTAEQVTIRLDRTFPWEVDGGDQERTDQFEIKCVPQRGPHLPTPIQGGVMTTVEKHTDDDEVGLEHAEEFARTHPGLVKFGRIGWVAKGVVYALTGFLALLIAFDRLPGAAATQSPGQEASQSGAIARIAERTGGVPLLLVIVAGLVIYSCWRIVSALLPADSDASSWITRIGYLVSAVTYLVLAGLAVSIASNHREAQTDASQKTEDSKVESFTRDLLGHSYGRTVVFLIGVVLICIAATFLREGDHGELPLPDGPPWCRAHLVRHAGSDGSDRVDRSHRDDGVDRVLPVPCGLAVQRRRGPGPRRFIAQGGDIRCRHRARRRRRGRTAGLRLVLHHQCAEAAPRRRRPLTPCRVEGQRGRPRAHSDSVST